MWGGGGGSGEGASRVQQRSEIGAEFAWPPGAGARVDLGDSFVWLLPSPSAPPSRGLAPSLPPEVQMVTFAG